MKTYIYHYPARRNKKQAALTLTMWLSSAIISATAIALAINSIINLTKQ